MDKPAPTAVAVPTLSELSVRIASRTLRVDSRPNGPATALLPSTESDPEISTDDPIDTWDRTCISDPKSVVSLIEHAPIPVKLPVTEKSSPTLVVPRTVSLSPIWTASDTDNV